MLYRFALVVGLLTVPLSTAHAAYQQHYKISPATETTQTMQQQSSSNPSQTLTGSWVEIGEETMTRAEFTATLVRALYTKSQIDDCFASIAPKPEASFVLIFSDVSVVDPYAKEICIGMRDGLVRGYRDGSFAPSRVITFAESAKILSRTFALAPFADADMKSPWYLQHIRALVVRNAVPTTITSLNQAITQDELNEMLERLRYGITWRPSQSETTLFPPVSALRTSVDTGTDRYVTGSSDSSGKTSAAPRSSSTSSATSQTPVSSASSKESFWHLF